jgi:hypothetical protein
LNINIALNHICRDWFRYTFCRSADPTYPALDHFTELPPYSLVAFLRPSAKKMQLTSFVAVASIATQAVFAQSLSQRFTVSDTCSSNDVDGMIKETINMADAAIKAIDELSKSSYSFGGPRKAYFAAAYTAFGVTIPKLSVFALGTEDVQHLSTAKDNFQLVKDALAAGKGISPDQNYFFCDSSELKWQEVRRDNRPRDRMLIQNPESQRHLSIVETGARRDGQGLLYAGRC